MSQHSFQLVSGEEPSRTIEEIVRTGVNDNTLVRTTHICRAQKGHNLDW